MTILVSPGFTFEAILLDAPLDLVSLLGFSVLTADGFVVIPRRTSGIVEATPGTYTTTEIAPLTVDRYLVAWDYGGSIATEDLYVAGGYASVGDVRAYAPELSTYSDEEIL